MRSGRARLPSCNQPTSWVVEWTVGGSISVPDIAFGWRNALLSGNKTYIFLRIWSSTPCGQKARKREALSLYFPPTVPMLGSFPQAKRAAHTSGGRKFCRFVPAPVHPLICWDVLQRLLGKPTRNAGLLRRTGARFTKPCVLLGFFQETL